MSRIAPALLLSLPALVGCASGGPPSRADTQVGAGAALPAEQAAQRRADRLDRHVMRAAVADGVSTGLALSAGALEMNPLVSTSPAGLLALTDAKTGLVKLADRLPEDEKRLVIKTSGSVWAGGAVNKLMVLLAAPSAVAVAAGVVAGVLWWRHSTRVYERADRAIAARRETAPLAAQPRAMVAATLAR